MHIIDARFPLVDNDGYRPPPFTVADYDARAKGLGIVGGAVVSGSFQAFDQTYLLDALQRLGPGFVGVTQLPADTPDSTILDLAERGVRAVRFNVRRGGSAPVDAMDTFARRVHDLAGWHAEFYVDAASADELGPRIAALPAASVDHLGLSAAGLPNLLRMVEAGVRVKATGFGRVDLDVPTALRRLCDANPEAVMFGTDLPSTRAPRPFRDADLTVLTEAVGEERAHDVLWRNAARFYRLDRSDQ
ncbi:amidohydrolase family protein [Spiractinospora alimapuensis]|nr:amidohydrolase family protein [Spiractinospora alimapuensis]